MQRALIIVVIMLSAAIMIGCGSYTSLQSPQKSPPKITAMSVNDVIALSKANTGDEVIIAQIKATHSLFALTNQEIIDLKNAGVSEKVIAAMIKTKAVAEKDSAVARYWYPSDYWWYAGYYWPGYYWYPRTYWVTSIYMGRYYSGHLSSRFIPAGTRSFGRR